MAFSLVIIDYLLVCNDSVLVHMGKGLKLCRWSAWEWDLDFLAMFVQLVGNLSKTRPKHVFVLGACS
jgi:hypothetical protein